MIRLEAPMPSIATMLVSVKRKMFAGTREGPYQPTRSKTFKDRHKRQNDRTTTEQRAYIAVNLSKNSYHKVQKVLLVVVQIS